MDLQQQVTSTDCLALCSTVDVLFALPQLRMDDSKLLPSINPELLLPEGIPSLVQQVLQWPGMSALLSWVSGGHYLGGLGPHDLGKALLDVQVRLSEGCRLILYRPVVTATGYGG
jgi:hypothetical protein